MSNPIEVPLVLDGSEILKSMSHLKETMIELSKQAGVTEQQIQAAFDAAAKKTQNFEQKIQDAVEANQELAKSSKKVGEAAGQFEEAAEQAGVLGDNTEAAKKKMDDLGKEGGKSLSGIKGQLKSIAAGIAAAFSIGAIVSFVKTAFTATAQMQKFSTMLRVALGSKSAAAEAMSMLSDFAKKTPFELTELTESYIKFANRGIKLTTEELTKLGDLASSQGKSFDQLTEAILDAGSGEFERLKEFGIKAKDAGDKVILTFKGQTTEVKKNEDAIQQAILAMGAYEGVAGGMAEQSKDLGGQMSNLGDNISQFASNVGAKLATAFATGLGALNSFFDLLNGFAKDKTLTDIRTDFNAQIDATQQLESTLIPLAKRYDELKDRAKDLGGETKLSKKEHDELNSVMNKIVDIVPDAATEFDKYGNVIAITTSKVYDFVQAQQDALKFKNKDIIDDTKQTIKSLENALLLKSTQLNSGSKTVLNQGESKLIAITKKEKENLIKETAGMRSELAQAKAFLDEVSGDFIKKRQDQVAEDKKQRDAEAKARRDEQDARDKAAKADKDRAKNQAAAEKAERERLQRIRENIQLEKEVNGARIDLMEAGKAKEIALENERSRAAAADLRFRLLTAAEGSTEEIKLNELMEIEGQEHSKNLLGIQVKYFQESEELARDAKSRLNELNLEGRELELAQLQESTDKQLSEVSEKYKNDANKRLLLIAAISGDSFKKEQEINNKYNQEGLKNQEEHDLLMAELTINNEEAKQLAVISIKKKYAELELSRLLASGADENSTIVLNAKKLIKDLTGDLDKAAEEAGKGAKGITGLLKNLFGGKLNDGDMRVLEDAFNNTLNNIFSALTDAADRQIEEKQRVVDALNEQVSEVEDALNKEKELQEQGFANNVGIKEKELAALKSQREKAQKEEEEAQKKRQAVAKAQLLIDGIGQISNMITASTNIFSVMSKIPFVGVPLAIGMIATMFGAFAAAKVQAFKMAGSQKFADGGEVGGKSHSQGGNKYLSMDGNDQNTIEIERGEFITNKKSTAKYKELLKAINSDTLSGWSIDRLGNFVDTDVRMSSKAKQEIIQIRQEGTKAVVVNTSDPVVRQKLESLDNNVKKMITDKENEEKVTDMGSYLIIQKGSIKRKVPK